MTEIIEYIEQKYNPTAIIIYGSYADGTNNSYSDFDALVISEDFGLIHDTSLVSGVRLDVFVYPLVYFENEYNCNDFVRIIDGRIIMDTENIGKNLQDSVASYLQNLPCKTEWEIKNSIEWCEKMFERSKRDDAEGKYRWHWVLIDSWEIFCDAVRHTYYGPKKTLKWMAQTQPEAFELYNIALSDFTMESLENWISYLKHIK